MMSSNTQTARRSAMNVRTMAQIGMLGAVAMVLMFFEIPLWFAPPFYKYYLSELPVLIGCFAMGPVAGVLIELVKILLYVVVHGTTTAGVGEYCQLFDWMFFHCSGRPDLSENDNKEGRFNWNGGGNCCDDRVGMCIECVCIASILCGRVWYADGCTGADGNSSQCWNSGCIRFCRMFAVAPFNILKGILVSGLTLALYKKYPSDFKKIVTKR